MTVAWRHACTGACCGTPWWSQVYYFVHKDMPRPDATFQGFLVTGPCLLGEGSKCCSSSTASSQNLPGKSSSSRP